MDEINEKDVPRVAALAINVKGADLLFLDHPDDSELKPHDRQMWEAVGVNMKERPFGRVIYYVPLADDGINRNTLRTNRKADQHDYSETQEFALGIQNIWPYLDLFFDSRSTAAGALLAEMYKYFEETNGDQGFTLAEVLNLFATQINLPQAKRKDGQWSDIHLGVIRSVQQRFESLPATLGALVDVNGKGFGLEKLTDLRPYDMVVIDIERIMTNPRDPEVAESAVKIITSYILNRLTEAMTRGVAQVDHVIVFADELNRLAPRREGNGSGSIGEYLAQLARTTRDRGIVLFGAGQFRSGIHEDILKAASVHYSMQTPEYELNDRIYSTLSPEFKARLTQLRPGETLIQYPSLRTAVFGRFPRPFVITGGIKWRKELPPEELPLAECIAERLKRLDPDRPPKVDEVEQLLSTLSNDADRKQIGALLRDIEMERSLRGDRAARDTAEPPWEAFQRILLQKFRQTSHGPQPGTFTPTPAGWSDDEEG